MSTKQLKMKQKKSKCWICSTLLGISGANLLRNLLTGKEAKAKILGREANSNGSRRISDINMALKRYR